jgi:hypothetical protein
VREELCLRVAHAVAGIQAEQVLVMIAFGLQRFGHAIVCLNPVVHAIAHHIGIEQIGLFDMAWDFPSVEPPNYLQRLSPELYQQECQRIEARFNEAVQLAEDAFTEELTKLVEHLSERLTGQQDGKPKVFRDTAITNLTEFFERFQRLNIRSNEELDELVEQAQGIVRGVQPQQLRENLDLRSNIARQLESVQNSLDDLLVNRPRRNILRKPR